MPKSVLESFGNITEGSEILGNRTDFALAPSSQKERQGRADKESPFSKQGRADKESPFSKQGRADKESPFFQPYDPAAVEMYPDLFYTKPDLTSEPIEKKKDPYETEPLTRIYLASLTFVGLFILFRCITK